MHVYEALQEPAFRDFFEDPITYRVALQSLLQRRIKIYRAGELYPYTSYTLINNENPHAGEEIAEMDLEPSGVWPLPAPPKSLILDPTGRGMARFRIDAGEAAHAFHGSVFPAGGVAGTTHAEIRASGQLEITQERLFELLPGIHYNFLCRSVIDEEERIRELLIAHFLPIYQRVEKRLAYNTIGTVGDLVSGLAASTPAEEAALAEIRGIVATVMVRRSASRSSSGKVRAAVKQNWQRLMRALSTTGPAPEGTFAALVAAVPDDQINQSEERDGRTALVEAAANGHLEAVKALLGRGADVEAVDYEGRRPLLYAAYSSPEIVLALLEAGATARITDVHGMTPLHYAAEKNSMVDVIPALVAAGIDPNTPDADGDRPIHSAVREGAGRAIRALLDAGADPNAVDGEGLAPLILAVTEEKINSVATLVRAVGITMDVKHTDGRSALAIALRIKHDSIALELVKHKYPVKDWSMLASAARKAGMEELYEYAVTKVRSSS